MHITLIIKEAPSNAVRRHLDSLLRLPRLRPPQAHYRPFQPPHSRPGTIRLIIFFSRIDHSRVLRVDHHQQDLIIITLQLIGQTAIAQSKILRDKPSPLLTSQRHRRFLAGGSLKDQFRADGEGEGHPPTQAPLSQWEVLDWREG